MNPPNHDPAANSATCLGRAGWLLRIIEVRFRFVLLLVALLLIFGGWSALQARFDWLWRMVRGEKTREAVVSSDTEYFCPMDPGVLSDWPEKCPVCQMALVRRKKGDAAVLPTGVTARMQLAPERVQLAGVRTAPVEYEEVRRELTVGGVIQPNGEGGWQFESNIARADIPLADRATAEALSLHVDGVSESSARASSLHLTSDASSAPPRVVVTIDDPQRQLRAGQFATVTHGVPAAEFEPFRSLSAPLPPLRAGEQRSVFACPNHLETLHEAPGKCPLDQQPLLERKLADNERVNWWCPMHPSVTADEPGHQCAECNGMRLVPRVISFAPPGTVLAVPESAVVDFGREQIVYVERMAGMYEGVRVQLGPACGGKYPVMSGLTRGDRVVAVGAFLLDAETRLNPSLASSYFGAGPNADVTTAAPGTKGNSDDELADEKIEQALSKLAPADRAAAERQGTCPVTGLPLGSMGAPIKVMAGGKEVFVCCEGCIGRVKSSKPTNGPE